MPNGSCENADCTVATTGKCLLSFPSLGDCKYYHPLEGSAQDVVLTQPLTPVIPPSPLPPGRTFHSGNEMGTQDAAEIMRARYANLIAVLGPTDAGKTCFLTSLYLMASADSIPFKYKFSGSRTLQAFEDRARGLRDWDNGHLPKQLVDHTFLPDKRQPSLLHLEVRRSEDPRRRFDLLFTDLPGEWTNDLILKASAAESFRFLHRADGIILVLDGKLLSSEQRHVELQNMRYFTDRLARDVGVNRDTPFVIVVSKGDEIGMQMPSTANELKTHIEGLGYPATLVICAAFSRQPEKVSSGTGVYDAIEAILSHPLAPDHVTVNQNRQTFRTFERFRG